MKALLLLPLLAGCAQLKPVSEYQHLSHATQHFGADRTNYGYDIISLGVRYQRPGIEITLLEGYCMQSMQGRREVFTGRLTVEF